MAVLLTLLSLVVKKIAINPNPPAFPSPGVLNFLQDKFDLRLTSGDPAKDLAAATGK
jgi:hydroxylamine reductase